MEFGEFFHLVARTRRGIAQDAQAAQDPWFGNRSVGCPLGPAGEYESDLLVEKLNQVREQIKKKRTI